MFGLNMNSVVYIHDKITLIVLNYINIIENYQIPKNSIEL